MKEIPPALFAIFQAEHAEHVEHIRSIVALGEKLAGEAGKAHLEEAFRRAHSLKGAARAVDLPEVEGLAHHLESLFARVRDGSLPLDQHAAKVIDQVLDCNEDCVAGVSANRTSAQSGAALRAIEELLGIARSGGIKTGLCAPAESPVRDLQPVEMVRLPAEDLDRLVRSTGRVVTESRGQKEVSDHLAALARGIAELESEWGRFSKLKWEGSAAGAGRAAGSQLQVLALQRTVHAVAGQARRLRSRQARAAWTLRASAQQLQQDVWNARMAPAEDVYQGFRKMVRDLARDAQKEVHFQLQGSGVRADRMVLQALKDPLMHLLRNAISHGLEPPAERERRGKPAAGTLTLRLGSQRGRLTVEVEDDGRGVDFAKVAEVAAQRGVPSPAGHAPGSPQALTELLFQPGFSTAPSINAVSGRGMGLSVVHETVRRLQGEVEVRPRAGPGLAMLLSVPLSVSTQHVLLVRCGGQTFGVPTHGIERLCRIQLEQIEKLEGKPVVHTGGRRVALFSLSQLLELGEGPVAFEGDRLPVMLVRSGAREVALLVDQFVGERDTLVQALGMPLPATGHVSGGAILADGSIVLILNPTGLLQSCKPDAAAPTFKSVKPAPFTLAPSILVVDDSITTRTLEKSILEAHGYRVRVALDGIEALQLLRAAPADLIITDIQMPRLDGFGLLEAVKADPQLKRIPVIIVSSLEQVEDQRRGLQLGADAYVTKGRFDQGELLAAIRQIV